MNPTLPNLACTAALLLASGCVFQSGNEVDDGEDTSVADMGRDQAAPSDTSAAVDQSAPDVGQMPDVTGPADLGPDAAPDMPQRVFSYRTLGTHRVVVPYRATFLGDAPTETPQSEDLTIQAHLRVAWSASVDWVSASLLPDAAGSIDLALISTDAEPTLDTELFPVWQNPPIPLWVLSRSSFNDTFLLDGDTIDVDNPEISVTDPFSELAVDLPLRFKMHDEDTFTVSSRSQPGRGAAPFEFVLPDNTTALPILAVDVGTLLTNDEPAAARRVADGADEADGFNWWGWILSDNVVAYLLANPIPAASVEPCVLVTGNAVTPIDFHLASRMRRNGCEVSFANSPPDNNAGLVVVSPTAQAPLVSQLAAHPDPVLVLFQSASTLAALGMAPTGQTGTDLGTSWAMRDEAPAGLRADRMGLVNIQAHGPLYSTNAANIAPGGLVIAARQGDADAVSYFVVEAGKDLLNGPAAGDRAALAMGTHILTSATRDGMSFFDAALQWAMWRTTP